jgi:hypothetical protein
VVPAGGKRQECDSFAGPRQEGDAMRVTATILAILLFAATPGYAQAPAEQTPKYDPATETTLKGTIGEIKQIQLGKDVHVDLVMKSGTDVFDVGVCPPDIFKDLIVTLAAGDEVQVTGSKVQLDQKPFVMAREIVKGNETLALRDKKGSPVWMWMRK